MGGALWPVSLAHAADVSSQASGPVRFLPDDAARTLFDVAALAEEARRSGRIEIRLAADREVVLLLEENDLWEGEMPVFVKNAAGRRRVEVKPPDLFKGSVEGFEESQVRLTFGSGWLSGHVRIGTDWYIIQPGIWNPDAARDRSPTRSTEHYIYKPTDLSGVSGVCEAMGVDLPDGTGPAHEARSTGTYHAKIVADGDVEFYDMDPGTCAARQAAVLNDVEGILEDQLDVDFDVTSFEVWETVGPLNSSDSGTLLEQLKMYWLSRDNPARHFVHLFTGKDLTGTVLGTGYQPGMGRCYGYSLTQQTATAEYDAGAFSKAILGAHQLGHNLDGDHAVAEVEAGPNPECGFQQYTIMYESFVGGCMVSHYSASNRNRMMQRVDKLSDTVPPALSLSINEGDEYANSADVTLTYAASDTWSGVGAVRFRNEYQTFIVNRCESSGTVAWTLPSGDGTKTVVGIVYDQADNSHQTSASIILDTTPPEGSIVINDDDVFTAAPEVALTLTSSDATSGVEKMRFRNDGEDWSDWYDIDTTAPWTLPDGDGAAQVRVQFKDVAGNESEEYSDDVILDTVPPEGSVVVDGDVTYTTSAEVTLTLAATDATSGLDEMRFKNDGVDWSSWEPYGTSKSWALPGADGQQTVWVEFKDAAGNSVESSDVIILDTTPPTCSITINGGDTYSIAQAVTLQLESTDTTSGPLEMRFKNDGGDWSSWEPYGTSKSWMLVEGDGEQAVWVEFKDGAGNTSECSDSIILDTTPPSCSITINGGDDYTVAQSVTLELASTDVTSATSEMRFRNAQGAWTLWEPYGTSKSWKLLDVDAEQAVWVKFKDGAGNSSECSDTIILDRAGPTCGISINGGDSHTASQGVTVELSSSDATSDVAEMSFKNDDGDWTEWEPYGMSKSWTLADADGERTVWVRFKDGAGNTSQCSDTIILDRAEPTCSISINSGEVYTPSREVTLDVSSSDPAKSVTEMRFKNDGESWSDWESYGTSKSWTLVDADGEQAVWVQFRDGAGNASECSDTIVLDRVDPTASIIVEGGAEYAVSRDVTLTLASSDATSGTSDMRFMNDGGGWSDWEPYGASKIWSLADTDGARTVYVQFRDYAGNTGESSDGIVLDRESPVCGISINNGNEYTSSLGVALYLASTDDGSGVDEMRFKNEGGSWSAWYEYDTSKSWALPAGDGEARVYAQFIDEAGNESQECWDSIILDEAGPSCGIIVDDGDNYTTSQTVTLTLLSDDGGGSGVDRMRFRNEGGSWSAWFEYGTSRSWTLAAGDGAQHVYAQFKDAAGNEGDACSDMIVLDATPPTCSLVISGGDEYATARDVDLAISASDATSDVDRMRFKNDGGDWGFWEIFGVSRSWSLRDLDGTRTVSVQIQDRAGNTSDCSDTIILDRAGPVCQLSINDGELYTIVSEVTLTLSSEDSTSGLDQARFKNDGGIWSAWESYGGTKTWMLSDLDGSRTVWVEIMDGAGLVGECSDAIVLDTEGPIGSVTIDDGAAYTSSRDVTLTLTASDLWSGVEEVRFRNEGKGWGDWEAYSVARPWTLEDADGTRSVWVEFRDGAGNSSESSASIVLDRTGPSCIISVDNGNPYAISPDVTLSLSAEDLGSGVCQMRLKNEAGSWSAWEVYSASKAWSLENSDGARTVSVQVQDCAGNTSESSDGITLDRTPPVGQVAINGNELYATSPEVDLTLSCTDEGGGVAEMRFMNDGGTWTDWESYGTSKVWMLVETDGARTVRVQFTDEAGNASEFWDTVVLDRAGPTGAVSINNGNSFTNSTSVTLAVSALDDGSGAGEMRFRNEGDAWSGWEPYAAKSATWTLGAGDGDKTVSAQFKDNAGNESGIVSDEIVLDATPPVVTVEYPESGAWHSEPITSFTGSADDNLSGVICDTMRYWYMESEAVAFSNDGPGCWSDGDEIPEIAEADGAALVVGVWDLAGNLGLSSPTIVRVDARCLPPENLQSPSHPDGDAWYSNERVCFSWGPPEDISGVLGYSYVFDQLEDTTPDAAIGLTSEETVVCLDAVEDGVWWFHMRASDSLGNWSDPIHRRVSVDTRPPVVSIDSPAGTGWVNAAVLSYFGAASDSASGVDMSTLEYSVQGGAWISFQDDGAAHAWDDADEIPPTEDTSGRTLRVRVRDHAGNLGVSPLKVLRVDRHGPSADVFSPSHATGAWEASRNAVVCWATSPDTSGIRCFSHTIAVETIVPDTICTTADTCRTLVDLEDGEWRFAVRGGDLAGNWGGADSITIRVDATPPEVTSLDCPTHPDSGRWYTDPNPVFEWESQDLSGVSAYGFLADHEPGGLPATDSLGTEPQVHFVDLEDGEWYFHVRARNGAGLWTEGSAVGHAGPVKVDVTPPPAVDNLNFTEIGDHWITLSWDWAGSGKAGSPDSMWVAHSADSIGLHNWDDPASVHHDLVLPGRSGRDTCVVSGLEAGIEYYIGVRVADAAGNASAVKCGSVTTVADATPPSIEIGILQNPVLASHLDIYVISSESLAKSSMTLTANTDTLSVAGMDEPGKLWKADYLLRRRDGTVRVCASACDLASLCTETCVSFGSVLVLKTFGGVLESPDGRLNLSFPEHSFSRDQFVLALEDKTVQTTAAGIKGLAPPVLEETDDRGRSQIYNITPSDRALLRPAKLRIKTDCVEWKDICPVGIYRHTSEGWRYVPSYCDPAGNSVVALIDSLGTYQVQLLREEDLARAVPLTLTLEAPMPNPFLVASQVRLGIPGAGRVNADIYDVRGRRVKTLLDETVAGGNFWVEWRGDNDFGVKVSSGIYFLTVRFEGQTAKAKLVFLK